MNGRPQTPASSRFWPKVEKTDGCWLWTAATAGQMGYGVIGETRTHMVYAHRLSWEMAYSPIPDGMFVLHHCDTPRCVRPDHLFLGTHQDNMRDRVAKGRHPTSNPKIRGEANSQAKLTVEIVQAIRLSEEPHRVIAADLGVSATLIRMIRKREAWRWVA